MRFTLAFLLMIPLLAEVRPETKAAFDRYVQAEELRMERDAAAGKFLLKGQTKRAVTETSEVRPSKDIWIPNGQAQHWIGAVFFPGATIAKVKSVMQDYDSYPRIYHPDITKAKLISHEGNDFELFLQIYKKQILTVVLDTTYRVHYAFPDPHRMTIRSHGIRIQEVDHDRGFLWGLSNYWRFQEADGGVYVECEAISLSRDVPGFVQVVVGSFLKKFPIESMRNTLEFTRKEVARKAG